MIQSTKRIQAIARRRIYLFSACFAAAILNVLSFQPEFSEPLSNVTVPVGRDATFKCVVMHLGGYRVGWVKADTKAIQAIHDHVITHNHRVSVSHDDHATWKLHIHNVQEEDRGQYMCQINTDPMKSQVGYLDVVIPPDFIPSETSGDVMLPEGGTVKLTCRARGYPTPQVIWRREDGQDIILKDITGVKIKVPSFQGETLKLSKITRSEMSAYLCIASNGVPPSVSKRIMVNVHFHPVIQVPNQLVGAPFETDVRLECFVEASPKAITYWIRESGEMVVSGGKYEIETINKSAFEARMTLIIHRLELADIGTYKCVAKNSIGEVESNIRIYEIPGPTKRTAFTQDDEDEYDGSGGDTSDEISLRTTNRVGANENVVFEQYDPKNKIKWHIEEIPAVKNDKHGRTSKHGDSFVYFTTPTQRTTASMKVSRLSNINRVPVTMTTPFSVKMMEISDTSAGSCTRLGVSASFASVLAILWEIFQIIYAIQCY